MNAFNTECDFGIEPELASLIENALLAMRRDELIEIANSLPQTIEEVEAEEARQRDEWESMSAEERLKHYEAMERITQKLEKQLGITIPRTR